jgi:hypothetical protein
VIKGLSLVFSEKKSSFFTESENNSKPQAFRSLQDFLRCHLKKSFSFQKRSGILGELQKWIGIVPPKPT